MPKLKRNMCFLFNLGISLDEGGGRARGPSGGRVPQGESRVPQGGGRVPQSVRASVWRKEMVGEERKGDGRASIWLKEEDGREGQAGGESPRATRKEPPRRKLMPKLKRNMCFPFNLGISLAERSGREVGQGKVWANISVAESGGRARGPSGGEISQGSPRGTPKEETDAQGKQKGVWAGIDLAEGVGRAGGESPREARKEHQGGN